MKTIRYSICILTAMIWMFLQNVQAQTLSDNHCKAAFYYYINDSMVTIPEVIAVSFVDLTGSTSWMINPVTQRPIVKDSMKCNVVKWFWDFGDGTTSDVRDPVHLYDQMKQKKYTACFTIIHADGFKSNYCQEISLIKNPEPTPETCQAKFSYLIDNKGSLIPENTLVSFFDESYTGNLSLGDLSASTSTRPYIQSNIATWYWQFGDDTFSKEQNPVHAFNKINQKEYKVCLTITSKTDCKSTYCGVVKLVNDTIITPPINSCKAAFNYSRNDNLITIPESAAISFYDLSYGNAIESMYGNIPGYLGPPIKLENQIVSWLWDFGDGTFSKEQSPVHIYDKMKQQKYLVTLTIATQGGCKSNYTNGIYLLKEPIPVPSCQAYFTYSHLDLLMPLNNKTGLSFLDLSTGKEQFYENSVTGSAPDAAGKGKIVKWNWNFGDGTYSFVQNPTHQFDNTKGNYYKVCLTTVTSDSCKSTYCGEVYLGKDSILVVDDFDIYWDYTLSGNTFQFNCNSDSARTLIWNFGDGNTATGKAVNHRYEAAGNYVVSLTIIENNQKTIYTKEVNVQRSVTTGINNNYTEFSNHFTLYPNPVRDILNIESNFDDRTEFQLIIYNMKGEEVLKEFYQINYGTYHLQVDVSKLSRGMYVVKMNGLNSQQSEMKFIK